MNRGLFRFRGNITKPLEGLDQAVAVSDVPVSNQLDSASQMDRRFARVAVLSEENAEVPVRRGHVRSDFHRLAIEPNRICGPSRKVSAQTRLIDDRCLGRRQLDRPQRELARLLQLARPAEYFRQVHEGESVGPSVETTLDDFRHTSNRRLVPRRIVLRECRVTRAVAEMLMPSKRKPAAWSSSFLVQRRPHDAVPVFTQTVPPQGLD